LAHAKATAAWGLTGKGLEETCKLLRWLVLGSCAVAGCYFLSGSTVNVRPFGVDVTANIPVTINPNVTLSVLTEPNVTLSVFDRQNLSVSVLDQPMLTDFLTLDLNVSLGGLGGIGLHANVSGVDVQVLGDGGILP
jgi:hypothetical protein